MMQSLKSAKPGKYVQFDHWRIIRGDRVEVLSGKNKGLRGEVKKVIRSRNMVVVEGVNLVKKHQPGSGDVQGGIYTTEAPLPVSTVALIDPSDDAPCRVRWVYLEGGEKARQSCRSGRVIPRNALVLTTRRKTEEGSLDTAPDVATRSSFSAVEMVPKLNWNLSKKD